MKKLSKKSRYLSAALLASCALSALDGTSIYAAATVAADENPLGVNQVTIRTDRNNLTVQRIGAQVTIENQYLGDEGLANLLQHLPANITSLRIRNAGITDIGITAFLRGDAGRHIRSLVTLDLGNNNIGEAGAQLIAKKLSSRLANVSTLNLENTHLGARGARLLTGGFVDALEAADGLRHHAPWRNNKGGYLHDSHTVSLNLAGNNIGDDGVSELVRRVRLPQNLAQLDLSNNGLTIASLKDLFSIGANVQRLPNTLQRLILRENLMSDDIAGILVGNHKLPSTIQTIDLHGNTISLGVLHELNRFLASYQILHELLDMEQQPVDVVSPLPAVNGTQSQPVVQSQIAITEAKQHSVDVVSPLPAVNGAQFQPIVQSQIAITEAKQHSVDVVSPLPAVNGTQSQPVVQSQIPAVAWFQDSGKIVHTNNFSYLASNFGRNKKHEQYIHLDESTTPEEALQIVNWVLSTPYAKKSLKNIENHARDPRVMDVISTILRTQVTPAKGFIALKDYWWK